jgi:hypothetical protein
MAGVMDAFVNTSFSVLLYVGPDDNMFSGANHQHVFNKMLNGEDLSASEEKYVLSVYEKFLEAGENHYAVSELTKNPDQYLRVVQTSS